MQEYWNRRFAAEGKIWSDAPSKTAEYAKELFQRNGVKNILIPGAGYGRNAELFHSVSFSVNGIEISDEALKLAREKNKGIRYYHGSVLDMPFSNDQYDAVFCFNVLHLFREKDRKLFIKKCYDQLADTGLVFFSVFSEKEPSYGKGNQVEDNTYESKPGRPVHYFTEEDLVEHFNDFNILESNLMEDPENHGAEGRHTHIVRYIFARKKSAYEFDGEKYKAASKHQKEWGNKLISELKLSGNESILDLGCGDGILTEQLASLVPKGKALGIDASEGMINTAQKLKKPNLYFQVMDINQINFDNEFDLVFSNAALHWVLDHRRMLGKIYTSLKSGGAIRFNFAGDGNCSNFYQVIQKVMDDLNFAVYFKDFQWPWYMPNKSAYEELAIESDFKEIKVWEENADRYFANAEEMTRWIDQPSIVPFLKYIDDEQTKKQFRDIVVKTMIDRTIQKDGTCFETFRRINVSARK